MDFEITREETILALVIASMGFLLSMRSFLLWLGSLNPIEMLLVYYSILYTSLYVLSRHGLVIYKFKIDDPVKVLGMLFITFAFFITVNWESCYINQVQYGTCQDVSSIYFGSEDGATYFFWNTQAGVQDVEQLRLLTYVLTPFVLVLAGAALLEHPKLL